MKIIQSAIRSILHFRMYSVVNIIGLALSLACVIIIFRYVYGELTVDRFNKKIDRIYLSTMETTNDFGNKRFYGLANVFRGSQLIDLANHPGVEKYSNFILINSDDIEVDDHTFNTAVLAADSDFLKITDYQIVSGFAELSNPKSAIITQRFAKKIFGDQNPVGKILRYSNGELLTITGIIEQTSTKSTLTFDLIISLHISKEWNRLAHTYVLLYPEIDYRTINKQYEHFIGKPSDQNRERYQLFPLSDVYLTKDVNNYGQFKQGNYYYVTVLMAVGFLILLAGIINYINIYTVVVLRRGKELGVKKVFGAGRSAVYLQLLTENLMTTGLALILALSVVGLANPFIINVLQLDQIPNI
jgi:ABC-type antimicrobial peptide transport system permease subunit